MFVIALTFQVNAQVILKCGNGSYDAFDSKFFNIGNLHNEHLSNSNTNFESPEKIKDYESGIKYVKEFNQNFLVKNQATYFGAQIESEEFVETISEKSKYFVYSPDFKSKLLSDDNEISLTRIESNLNKTDLLDANNKKIFSDLTALIKMNISSQIKSSDYENQLGEIANDWIKANENNKEAKGADLTGSIISIGLKSCEWWNKNGEILFDNPSTKRGGPNAEENYVVPVVALDVAGALVSSCAVALNQYINTGHVTLGAVATGAVIGAVTGSTGLVGKVGKWLSSLF